ncbi:unnamed protein product [Linum trigynum]|uniref:DUF4283 domain-containing protein n=1 Tax=Linum trigynum TaxID=586398 RepID=A0AAV2CFC9_9ROSI
METTSTSEEGRVPESILASNVEGRMKVSYKDSFLGNEPPAEILQDDELMSGELEGEDVEDDPECPTIRIKKSKHARVRNRWKRDITFRVLGRTFPFAFIDRRVQKMWARTGGSKLAILGIDFDSISHAMVWVWLPRLPLAYFDEEIRYDIGDRLGRVEKIYYNTANGSRGNYARICVEIDLRKKLISK